MFFYRLSKILLFCSFIFSYNLNSMSLGNPQSNTQESENTPPTRPRRYSFGDLLGIGGSPRIQPRRDMPVIPGLTLPPTNPNPQE
ncbi:MAG: hypothetical protein ABIF12_00275 [bacterium]